MAEHIKLPGAAGVGAHHVALKAETVDGRPDGGFGAGQVGVRLVVGAADDLDPPGPDQGPQLLPAVGVEVPERLQIVHLGEDNLV